jgi:hypothetical protein
VYLVKIDLADKAVSSIHSGGSGASSNQAMEAPSRCSHNLIYQAENVSGRRILGVIVYLRQARSG